MRRAENREALRYLGLVSQVGLIMVGCVLGGLFIGLFIDRRIGRLGPFTIALTILGVAGGFWQVYRVIMKMQD